MALITLPSPILWPGNFGQTNGGPNITNTVTLSSAGHYLAHVFCAKENMTVSHVYFRAANVAGAPTADVRIETVDTTTGMPSGTLWGTNTNGASGTITTNSNNLVALTASASISRGQVFCVKIAYASGTSIEVSQWNSASFSFQSAFPYYVTNTGTPTKNAQNTNFANIALGSSSTTFYQQPGAIPASSTTGGGFNNTNSAKRGLRFTPPMNCRVIGVRWHNSSSTGDYNVVLSNDAGTELSSSSTAFDGDIAYTASGNGTHTVYFDNAVTLTAGTTYRAAIEPTTATNVTLGAYVLPSANYRGASPSGTTAHYTTFATATWTDTATDTVPFMDIVIDQVDDGTGSGGGGGVVGVIGS